MSEILLMAAVVAGSGVVGGYFLLRQGREWARTMTVICALGVIGLLLVRAFYQPSPAAQGRRLIQSTAAYETICGLKLGEYLAGRYPQTRVLILLRPTVGPEAEANVGTLAALADGMKKGGQGKLTIETLTPPIPEEFVRQSEMLIQQHGGTPPLPSSGPVPLPQEYDTWFTPALLEDLLRQQPQMPDLVVFAFWNPFPLQKASFLQESDQPKIVLAGFDLTGQAEAMRSGIVVAAVVQKKQFESRGNIPSLRKANAAFDERYILITPENLAEILPQLFTE